jgi:diaminopimelate epimerase
VINISLIVRAFVKHNLKKMQVEFYKYQGTGNDFVMIDNRLELFQEEDTAGSPFMQQTFWGGWLILLENDPESDFKMVYYNSDGSQSTMCGNGGRCLVAFKKIKSDWK